jgi:hypothetical protein
LIDKKSHDTDYRVLGPELLTHDEVCRFYSWGYHRRLKLSHGSLRQSWAVALPGRLRILNSPPMKVRSAGSHWQTREQQSLWLILKLRPPMGMRIVWMTLSSKSLGDQVKHLTIGCRRINRCGSELVGVCSQAEGVPFLRHLETLAWVTKWE